MKPRDPQGIEHLAPARVPATEPVRLPESAADGEILSWTEVNLIHRTRNGIYHRQGQIISLLTDFGRINPCYPDRFNQRNETIHYTGEGRHGDQQLSPGNRSLLAAIEAGHGVPLFNKLAVGRWLHMGLWRVTNGEHRFDEREDRMLWCFTLQRATADNS
ncbi:MAG: hypothetical protein H0T92_05150 [Pyrinomonadaceae bacterium]|nr:hypothetical protein [Pyrinomonadaceae bacterium]